MLALDQQALERRSLDMRDRPASYFLSAAHEADRSFPGHGTVNETLNSKGGILRASVGAGGSR
jgi:hypothetical protein